MKVQLRPAAGGALRAKVFSPDFGHTKLHEVFATTMFRFNELQVSNLDPRSEIYGNVPARRFNSWPCLVNIPRH
ncbi:hypothetical protein LENED_011914 [Lentinula edodes]|uniref:Uncharacterized protein n=1 Tax=Lentinula edodes TaxID=5353 RepID=A0A1Q3ER95_LENED|nr:hypothetical protein LENED_011914 [Lentinula edodes]